MTVNAAEILNSGPVIPVMVIKELESAVPLAKALVAGGIKVLEITLRTPQALDAIWEISRNVPDAIVGAGTVINADQFKQSIAAGGQFVISPGLTPNLLAAARSGPIPLIPGIASVSELMLGLEYGLTHFKFFPAAAAGGIPLLKSFYGPLPQAVFCPTGGISPDNYRDYLALPNVACVGGSWLAPEAVVKAHDWAKITDLAHQAGAAA